MNQHSSDKKPWFRPKTIGIGFTPRTWQGWLFIVVFVAVELTTILVSHYAHPAWFMAKELHAGWFPITWQGWSVTLIPAVVFTVVGTYIYFRQKN